MDDSVDTGGCDLKDEPYDAFRLILLTRKLYVMMTKVITICVTFLKSLGQPLSSSISITFFSFVTFFPLQVLHLEEQKKYEIIRTNMMVIMIITKI